MMMMTSAIANKMLKQLEDEKNYWETQEKSGRFYRATANEEPVIPTYDYTGVSKHIDEIDNKIVRIKHAINLANVNTTIKVGDKEMTVDQILVSMAQKNKRKALLNVMRSHPEVERVSSQNYYGGATSKEPEYEYANYPVEWAKYDYSKISQDIIDMQLALDNHNQTFEFEVDI